MSKLILVFILICGSITLDAQVTSTKKVLTEKEKIEALITSVEKLDGAKFIRNGSEYDAVSAASHLRMKLGKAGSQVKTAEDFIEKIASKSSMTGEAYQIKFKDGSVMNTRDYIYGKLKALNQAG